MHFSHRSLRHSILQSSHRRADKNAHSLMAAALGPMETSIAVQPITVADRQGGEWPCLHEMTGQTKSEAKGRAP